MQEHWTCLSLLLSPNSHQSNPTQKKRDLLDHPQQSPHLLFINNECAIGLVTSSVRPKKSKSSDRQPCVSTGLKTGWGWAKAWLFRLVFIPCLLLASSTPPISSPKSKIVPVYRHLAALPFLFPSRHPPSTLKSHTLFQDALQWSQTV
jgi:hypothetical protein